MRCDIYFKNQVEVVSKFYYSIYRTSQQLLFSEREALSRAQKRACVHVRVRVRMCARVHVRA